MRFWFMTIMAFFAASQLKANEIKIGFVLSTLQEERYQKDQRYFIEEAKKLGFEPIVVAAENNPQTQAAKVENLLSRGVKALVIQPVNSDAASTLVKMAHEDKVPVIAYDRLINNSPVDYWITQNPYQVGKIQAEAAAKALNGKGNVVILSGQAGHNIATEITRGNLDELKKYPQITVVVQKAHDQWSPSLALATTENALTQFKNNIHAILANNSGMANAAVQAVGEQKLSGKVFIAGADADLSAIKNIVSGKQQLDVIKEIAPLAQAAARVAFDLATGKKPEFEAEVQNGQYKVPVKNTPVYGVNKDNLEERIFKTGFHRREDVYSNSQTK
jgi:D-xylose transport system substrate-binding protein